MKNIIKILVLALFSMLCVACSEKFLDAPAKSSMDQSLIFSTPALAKEAIAGMLQSFAETNSYRGRYIVCYGTNTDVDVRNGLSGTKIPDGKAFLSNYKTNVDNDQMNTSDQSSGAPNNFYSMAYQGIERANLAINGLRTYADLNNWELAQIL